jgi:hypothetical protein
MCQKHNVGYMARISSVRKFNPRTHCPRFTEKTLHKLMTMQRSVSLWLAPPAVVRHPTMQFSQFFNIINFAIRAGRHYEMMWPLFSHVTVR